jgi:hypothetical protein
MVIYNCKTFIVQASGWNNHVLSFYWKEQHALKNVNNCLNTYIHSYLETSGGQSSYAYLNVVHFFNARVD